MIKPHYPWPTPPNSGYRSVEYKCHNCGSTEETLGVGSWMNDFKSNSPGRLVLCKTCFTKLENEMLHKDHVQGFVTRLKILFTGKIK